MEIPALGYKVFEVLEGSPEESDSDIRIAGSQIENEYYRISWNKKGLSSIFSKKLNKEILNETGNRLHLLEDNGSAWGLTLTGKVFETESLKAPEIVFSSPLKVVLKWEDVFQSSKFTRYMTVYANKEEIEFEMEVDWHSSNKLLRILFPTTLNNGRAFYEQPYGYAERKESDLDYPGQNWMDYSNEDWGISLLNNGKHGFTMKDGEMGMSVVRGSRDMNPRMDEGYHSFKYTLILHEGDWRTANTPQKAMELNQPLLARQETHHPGEISGWKYKDESFPLKKSFFGIDSDHVIISSLKTQQDAYNPNPLILRIVETEGRSETVTVNLPYEPIMVKECSHIEQPIESRSEINVGDKEFSFDMGNDQIRTFMIYF
jgi:alpha-mannosidase